MAGFERILIICPPHLVPKWKREVEMTVPGVRAAIVESITDLERLRLSVGSGPLFAVMSREKAKLSYRWMPAVIQRWAVSRGRLIREEETGEPFRVPCCPDCTAQVVDKDGVPLTGAGYGSPLWQADRSGPARYPLADYIKHRMKGFFDLLIGDEVHEFKGRGSAQGIAAGILADVCGKSLSLTGTLLGGYSSTIFHLLYRFSPEIRTEFGRSDEHRWIQRYGFEEITVGKPDDDAVEDGRNSRRRKYRKVVRERPGLVPSALFHIIGNTVFLRLADVASGLPDYEEKILVSSMDSEEDSTGYSQRTAYNTVFEKLRLKLAEALKAGSKRLLATYLQTLLAYPDGCTKGETVFDPRSGDVIVQVPPLSEERLYPKEKALIDMVAAERMEGRRALVYVTHTGTRDITDRMDDMLTRHGFRVAVMKADAVAPERREAWVADKVKQGIDVMICHPRLVQTGLDLIDFPTLIWYETEFFVFQSTENSQVHVGGGFGYDRVTWRPQRTNCTLPLLRTLITRYVGTINPLLALDHQQYGSRSLFCQTLKGIYRLPPIHRAVLLRIRSTSSSDLARADRLVLFPPRVLNRPKTRCSCTWNKRLEASIKISPDKPLLDEPTGKVKITVVCARERFSNRALRA